VRVANSQTAAGAHVALSMAQMVSAVGWGGGTGSNSGPRSALGQVLRASPSERRHATGYATDAAVAALRINCDPNCQWDPRWTDRDSGAVAAGFSAAAALETAGGRMPARTLSSWSPLPRIAPPAARARLVGTHSAILALILNLIRDDGDTAAADSAPAQGLTIREDGTFDSSVPVPPVPASSACTDAIRRFTAAVAEQCGTTVPPRFEAIACLGEATARLLGRWTEER
jgi:hypothetical protein